MSDNKQIATKLSNDDELTDQETAYLAGWMAASSLSPRSNPYEKDSTLAQEYNRGYTESLCDSCDY